MKPLIKWVGGKRRLASSLAEVFYEAERKKLIEPFAGSAALFWKLEHPKAVLNDTCAPLVTFYRVLKTNPKGLVQHLRNLCKLSNSERTYKKLRDEFNAGVRGEAKQAAYFLWLNRHCFQGLWRVNRSGAMNTPFGGYASPKIPSKDAIFACSELLQKVAITQDNYDRAINKANKGDFIYADPPYLDTFDGYTSSRFSKDEHGLLAEACELAASRGVMVVVSNRDDPHIRKLYPKKRWHVHEVSPKQSLVPHHGERKPELVIISKER